MARSTSSLPPELWHRIFVQHNKPEYLWIQGRQVCSFWRSEIPKVFAEKYLQDPLMTEIYYDCDGAYIGDELCYMGMKMQFARFEDDNKRCVFAESDKTGTCKRQWEDDEWEEY